MLFDSRCEMDAIDSFIGLKDKKESILPILAKYDFVSSLTAVFAIASWRYNRGAQESCLALNLALSEINEWGDRKIVVAQDLDDFFNEIYPYLKVSFPDDPVAPDFGEIKLAYKERYYSVITGTGHTAPIFSALQFLDRISRESGMDSCTRNLLEYSDSMIAHLSSANAPIDSEFSTDPRFEVPSFEYFFTVRKFIDSKRWLDLGPGLLSMLAINNNDIVRSHFVLYKDEYYPIFNPSLLIDYQIHILNETPLTSHKAIATLTLADCLYRIYGLQKTSINRVFRNCLLLNNKSILLPAGNCFVYLDNDNLVVFLYCSFHDEYEKTIQSLQMTYENNSLSIVDLDDRPGEKGYKAYNVKNSITLNIIAFDGYINPDEERMIMGVPGKKTVYTAIDLMYMIMISTEIAQIVKFDADDTRAFSWGGASDYFTTFLCEEGCISKGALEFGTVYFDADTAAAYILSRYISLENVFPFHLPSSLFEKPECWNIVIEDTNVYQFTHKCHNGFCGSVFKFSNGCVIYLSFDLIGILKGSNITQAKLSLDFFRSITERFFLDYYDELSKINPLSNCLIQFVCQSLTNDNPNEYVSSSVSTCNNNKIIVECKVNSNKIEKDIASATDRTIEISVIKDLIQPLVYMSEPSYSALLEKLTIDSKGEKKVGATSFAVEHYFNPNTYDISETESAELSVRKQIAIVCLKTGVKPGIYEHRDATRIVRQIQQQVVGRFEQLIIPFDKDKLNSCVLSAVSTTQLSISINRKSALLCEGLAETEKAKTLEKSTYLYENAKSKKAALIYLLETNLFLCEGRGDSIPNEQELSELLSFAKWLVYLQNSSDLCYHTDSETKLEVLDDFRIDVILGEHYLEVQNSEKQRRIIAEPYNLRLDDVDKNYLEKLFEAFYTDTGVSFKVIESVLHQLSDSSFTHSEVQFEEIAPNVIKANAKDLIKDYSSYVTETVDSEDVKKAYDYLTLDSSKLKSFNGKENPFLPIWEREKRDNRFETKPIIMDGDDYIFSPIIVEELRNRWRDGIFQFYLPYEIGLENTCNVLYEWKNHYEKYMSSDVERLLKESGCQYAKHDVDLRREDRNGNHPTIEKLGDYDVIGLNITRKKIYLIECKFLRPIGSVFEHSTQQRQFFFKDRKDELFQKRIDYFDKIAVNYFASQGFSITDDFVIEKYMVVNKVFSSYYKEVDFQIVTIDELKHQICKSVSDS